MLLEYFFERFSVDRLVIVGLWFHVNLRYFLDEKLLFLFVSKIFLLQVAAEEGSPYQTLYDSIHVASVADVIQTRKLVDLIFFRKVLRVEFLEILVIL